jgi:UDPglucose 6-dehydrogenase
MKIGFVGLGKLGLPCAEIIAEKGHYVKGFDINPVTSNAISITDKLVDCVKDCEIVFIAVPTPHDSRYDGQHPTSHLPTKDFSYEIVREVLTEINQYMNNKQLLVLISTVLPGTTRNELSKLVTNTNFVYNPYLIAMGSVAYDMVNPEMVMIGTLDGSVTGPAQQLTDFYRTIMENNPRYVIGTYDEIECIKVFYNTFISAKLGLVNMIQDVAMKQGNINVDVVTDALAQSTMRIMGPQYMIAGMGDGGSCHPRDNIALRHLANKLELGYDLFDAIMTAREMQAKNLANLLIDKATQNCTDGTPALPIYIFGKSYKPGVPYCDGSYSMLIGYYINESGFACTYIDPLTEDTLIKAVHGVVLLAHNNYVTYKYKGVTSQQGLYSYIEPGSIVVDPWRTYVNPAVTVIHYGNTRYM